VESLFTTSLHISYFVQTQNEAKILTLNIGIKKSDQSGEDYTGVVVEVAPMICLDELINAIQWSNQEISANDIPFWNDCHVQNSISKSCHILLGSLSDSLL